MIKWYSACFRKQNIIKSALFFSDTSWINKWLYFVNNLELESVKLCFLCDFEVHRFCSIQYQVSNNLFDSFLFFGFFFKFKLFVNHSLVNFSYLFLLFSSSFTWFLFSSSELKAHVKLFDQFCPATVCPFVCLPINFQNFD